MQSNGHLNVLVRDHDSVVTAFGKHDRVVAFSPDAEGLYARVDHKWGLGHPTPEQVLTVARKTEDVRGRWKFDRSVEWTSNGELHTDFHFVRAVKDRA